MRRTLRAAWALARPYWSSDERWTARLLLAALVALNLAIVYVNVLFSEWNNRFYDALQAHAMDVFWHELRIFCALAVAFIVVAVYQTYLGQMLQIRWRRWLTERYLNDWLGDRAYYHLELDHGRLDNPDQRIASDLLSFVDGTLSLALGLLSSVVTLASFAVILWRLSGTLTVPIGDTQVGIPGYMLWAALVYSVAGSWLTHRIGRPLAGLNFDQQRFEADFRFSLVRLRENTEAVALYGGERQEALGLQQRFRAIVANWWAIMKRQKQLTWFTSGYAQAAIVFPILAAAPRYFAGAIQLGGLMQTAQAFGQVQGALSWFVNAYTGIAEWKATTDRLTGFRAALGNAKAVAAHSLIRRIPHGDAAIHVRDLTVSRPGGERLISGVSIDLLPGEWLLVTGPTGTGKSTLLRALAGIWPFGCGVIEVPENARVLFLPQRPYLPVGSLRAAVSYPSSAAAFDDRALREALDACGLHDLADRLDEEAHWTLQLSPGEQQRIGFARALLHAPDWLFLDEATAALDEPTEARLYALLKERLPHAGVVSVAHRSTLAAFHERRLDLGLTSSRTSP